MNWRTETTCMRKSFISVTSYDMFGSEMTTLGIINYVSKCKKDSVISITITPVKTDNWGKDSGHE